MAQHGVSEMAKAPTFKSLKAAAEAGYHGKSVNIEGKGLQKVAFADKEYDKKMAARSAAASKKGSVIAPPPRPNTGTLIGGEPIKEMGASSAKSQRTMSMRGGKITETNLDKKSSGRGSGSDEAFTRRMQAAVDRAKAKSPKDYTYAEWKGMTPAQRKAAGLPVSVIGGEMGFKRFRTGLTGREYTMSGK